MPRAAVHDDTLLQAVRAAFVNGMHLTLLACGILALATEPLLTTVRAAVAAVVAAVEADREQSLTRLPVIAARPANCR